MVFSVLKWKLHPAGATREKPASESIQPAKPRFVGRQEAGWLPSYRNPDKFPACALPGEDPGGRIGSSAPAGPHGDPPHRPQ